MAMDPMWQLRGVWSGTAPKGPKAQASHMPVNGKVSPEGDAENGLDSPSGQGGREADADKLILELRSWQSQAAELRQQLEAAEAQARECRERADEVQEQSMLALDEASMQVQQLNKRLQESMGEAQKAKRQHEEELIMVMMSAKEKDDIRLAREAELEKELRALQQRMDRMKEDMAHTDMYESQQRSVREDTDEQVNSLSQQLETAQGQLDELHQQLAEDEDELDAMEEELKKSRKRVDDLAAERASLAKEVAVLQEQLSQEKELAGVAERVAEDEVNRRLDAERQCAAALRELARVRAEAEAAEEEFEAGQKEDEEALTTLQEQLTTAMEQYAAQEEEFSRVMDEMKRESTERETEFRKALESKERELAANKEALAELEEKETVAEALCGRLREENHRLKVEAAELASTLSRLEADNRRLKEAVEAARSGAGQAGATGQPGQTGLQVGGEAAGQAKAKPNHEEYASGSEFSFSLPVPIKGAWRAARELAAEYYDAGIGNEEDELAAREAELEEMQEENERLGQEVEALQDQIMKSRRLVANYEKMRRRIMQLRVCLELTRKVVEVKDRAMEMAIERARNAETHARELEEIQIQLEEQLAEVEDELARALSAAEQRTASGAAASSSAVGPDGLQRDVSLRDDEGKLSVPEAEKSKGTDGRRLDRLNQMKKGGDKEGEGASAGQGSKRPNGKRLDRLNQMNVKSGDEGDGSGGSVAEGFPKSDTVGSHKKLGLKLDLPSDSEDDEDADAEREEKDVVHMLASQYGPDKEIVGAQPSLQRVESRRPKPLVISKSSSTASRNSEAGAPRVMSVSVAGTVAPCPPVGLKDLQQSRDNLKRVLRELREKAAVQVEAQIELGERAPKKKGKGKDGILRPVEEQVVEGQSLVDRADKVLGKMAALEHKGGALKKKMDLRKQHILEVETKLGLNASRRRNGASCFR